MKITSSKQIKMVSDSICTTWLCRCNRNGKESTMNDAKKKKRNQVDSNLFVRVCHCEESLGLCKHPLVNKAIQLLNIQGICKKIFRFSTYLVTIRVDASYPRWTHRDQVVSDQLIRLWQTDFHDFSLLRRTFDKCLLKHFACFADIKIAFRFAQNLSSSKYGKYGTKKTSQ